MAKQHVSYTCRKCGKKESQWMGRCPSCKEWDTFDEVAPEIQAKRAMPVGASVDGAVARPISEINSDNVIRMATSITEFDRVLGGGIVPGAAILVGGDPGVGKCVTGDCRVLDPETGAFLPITEWENSPRAVLALDTNTYHLAPQKVAAFFDQGTKPIVEVKTRLGRVLRCTPSHPVFTEEGWVPVGELEPGAKIAGPRALPYFGKEEMSERRLTLIVTAICDGMKFIQKLPADERQFVQSLGFSANKTPFLPSVIFTLTKRSMAFFLQTLSARVGRGSYFVVEGLRLAQDLQHLLLRFGVVCSLQESGWSNKEDAYEVKPVPEEKASKQLHMAGHILGLARRAGEIYWDEIESITPAGEERVYDISVPAGENFVANDLIIHNSTLLLWAAELVARKGLEVLYVSGEESAEQIALRGARLGAKSKNLRILPEIVIEKILDQVQRLKPALVIIDSIQTVYLAEIAAPPGSMSQIREGALRFTQLAKNSQIPMVFIGHVTKDGALAGPKLLEHMVDVVLHMEGERAQHYRLLRANKNRFGATDEVGVFEMASQGLVEVPDPSAHFLAERPDLAPGSVVVASQSASRPLLVEVQALVAPPGFSSPRRTADGFDQARVALLLAVLERRAGLILHDRDVFVNVVGGIKLDEPAADLGVALAVASSYTDRPAQKRVGVFGEIGLTGEIRAAARPGPRIKEMARHGFHKIIMPIGNLSRLNKDDKPDNCEIFGVKTIEEALEHALI